MKIKVLDPYKIMKLYPKELPTLKTPIGELDKFWRKIFGHPKFETDWKDHHGCWIWEGSRNKEGEPIRFMRDLRTGNRKPVVLKQEIAKKYIDTKDVPWRKFKHKDTDEPDLNVIHHCGNINCLNPAHFVVCINDARHRDLKSERDKDGPYLLPPGTFHNGDL